MIFKNFSKFLTCNISAIFYATRIIFAVLEFSERGLQNIV